MYGMTFVAFEVQKAAVPPPIVFVAEIDNRLRMSLLDNKIDGFIFELTGRLNDLGFVQIS